MCCLFVLPCKSLTKSSDLRVRGHWPQPVIALVWTRMPEPQHVGGGLKTESSYKAIQSLSTQVSLGKHSSIDAAHEPRCGSYMNLFSNILINHRVHAFLQSAPGLAQLDVHAFLQLASSSAVFEA